MKPTKEQYIEQLKLLDSVMEQTMDTSVDMTKPVSQGEVTIRQNDEYFNIDPSIRLLKNANVTMFAHQDWDALRGVELDTWLALNTSYYLTKKQFVALSPHVANVVHDAVEFIWIREREETLYFFNTNLSELLNKADSTEYPLAQSSLLTKIKKVNISIPKQSEPNQAYANYSPILAKAIWFGYASSSLHLAFTGLTLLLGAVMGIFSLNPFFLALLIIAPVYLFGARFLWNHREQNIQTIHNFMFRFIGPYLPGFLKEHRDMVIDSTVVNSAQLENSNQKALDSSTADDLYTSKEELDKMISDLTQEKPVTMPNNDSYVINTDFKRLKSLSYLTPQMSGQDYSHFVTCVTSLHEVYETIVEVAECGNTPTANFVAESIQSTYIRLEPVFDRIERNAMQPNEDKAVVTDMFLKSKFSEMLPTTTDSKEPKNENTISFFNN